MTISSTNLEMLTPMLQPYPAAFTHASAEIDAGGHLARGIFVAFTQLERAA